MPEATFTVGKFVAGDGYPLHFRHYPAGPSPRAAVVAIHGIQSHAGWYEYSCQRLSQAGYEVFFLDRRGSGMNQQARGDAPSFRCLIDDLAEFLRYGLPATVSFRGLPIFLVAISWGGKLAVALQRRHPGLVAGLALVCPGFFPQVRPSLGQRLAIFRTRLFNPTRLFPVPLDDPELFTANPPWLEFLRNDPLSLHQATARFLIESARLDVYLRFCPRHVNVPVLLLLARRDRIIHNQPTRRYVQRFASPDKQMIEYPEAYHTLEFEPDPAVFLKDLITWLEGIA